MPRSSFGGFSGAVPTSTTAVAAAAAASRSSSSSSSSPSAVSGAKSSPLLSLINRKLSKSHTTTLLKALAELTVAFENADDTDMLVQLLPSFVFRFNRLALANDHTLRIAVYDPLVAIVQRLKRAFTSSLRAVFPAWFMHQHDPVASVAARAQHAFVTCFPTPERQRQVVGYCAGAFRQHALSVLGATAESLSELELQQNAKHFTLVDAQERYDRVVYSTLVSLAQIDATAETTEATTTTAADKCATSSRPLVRRGWYTYALTSKSTSYPLILRALGDTQRANHAVMWQLVMSRAVRDAPPDLFRRHLPPGFCEKSVYPRLLRLFESAGYGSSSLLFQYTPTLMQRLPEDAPFERLLAALWRGGVTDAMVTAFGKCVRMLLPRMPELRERVLLPTLIKRIIDDDEDDDDDGALLPVSVARVWQSLLSMDDVEMVCCRALETHRDACVLMGGQSLTLHLAPPGGTERIRACCAQQLPTSLHMLPVAAALGVDAPHDAALVAKLLASHHYTPALGAAYCHLPNIPFIHVVRELHAAMHTHADAVRDMITHLMVPRVFTAVMAAAATTVVVVMTDEYHGLAANGFLCESWRTALTSLPSSHPFRLRAGLVPMMTRREFEACFEGGGGGGDYLEVVRRAFWDDPSAPVPTTDHECIHMLACDVAARLFDDLSVTADDWHVAAVNVFEMPTTVDHHARLQHHLAALKHRDDGGGDDDNDSEAIIADALRTLQRYVTCMNQLLLVPAVLAQVKESPSVVADILRAERELLSWLPVRTMPIYEDRLDSFDAFARTDPHSLTSRLATQHIDDSDDSDDDDERVTVAAVANAVLVGASSAERRIHWRHMKRELCAATVAACDDPSIVLRFFCSTNFLDLPLMAVSFIRAVAAVVEHDTQLVVAASFDPSAHLRHPFPCVLRAVMNLVVRGVCARVSTVPVADDQARSYLTDADLETIGVLVTPALRGIIESAPSKRLEEAHDPYVKMYVLGWWILLRVLMCMRDDTAEGERRKLLVWAWLRDEHLMAPLCSELMEHLVVDVATTARTVARGGIRLEDTHVEHASFVPNAPAPTSATATAASCMERLKHCRQARDHEPECFYTALCAQVYANLLHTLPGLMYGWYTNADRAVAAVAIDITRKYFSPLLIHAELRTVLYDGHVPVPATTTTIVPSVRITDVTNDDVDDELDAEAELLAEKKAEEAAAAAAAASASVATVDGDEFHVRVNRSSAQISAQFVRGEFNLSLQIRLPGAYPLEQVDIRFDEYRGVTASRARRWELTTASILGSHNGSIHQAIQVWRRNTNKYLEGVEECPVCYAIVHSTNHTLPRMQCSTCKHRFHSLCLYKWFNTSGASSCPMCRSLF